ncbi:hypothetical protein M8A51_24980 [Schlegelella sp. S2-27]|uniref:Type III effector protein n=1 Tax=Caldimonas mangrovi TaxID=2944811 RepID=A0ABT0YW36_9BURK|nr:hypothetical protein [Caldimonas mangrovi]MCM5682798.1 hypothetical protein [Caldimonas mangrovi]
MPDLPSTPPSGSPTPWLDPPVRPRSAGNAPAAARNAAPAQRSAEARSNASPFMNLHADIHHEISKRLDVTSNIQLARATESMEPGVAADYRDAARRKAKDFLCGIDPHQPKHPTALFEERAALDRIVGRFVSEPAASAEHREAGDADIAALTRLKLHVLKTECNEAHRACLTHLVMPARSAGPETSKAYHQILDSIRDMKNPEAQAQALVRYLFTVPLDGFPSAPSASADRTSLLGRFGTLVGRALSASGRNDGSNGVLGAPPPGWQPPVRGSAEQLLRELVQQAPHIGRALDMAAALPAYPSPDPVTPQTIADVFSARLPHHPSMPFARFDYLAACQRHMRTSTGTRPGSCPVANT